MLDIMPGEIKDTYSREKHRLNTYEEFRAFLNRVVDEYKNDQKKGADKSLKELEAERPGGEGEQQDGGSQDEASNNLWDQLCSFMRRKEGRRQRLERRRRRFHRRGGEYLQWYAK